MDFRHLFYLCWALLPVQCQASLRQVTTTTSRLLEQQTKDSPRRLYLDFDIANELIDETTVFEASGSFLLSMDISHFGGVDESGPSIDIVQVFYAVDGGDEILWLDIVGANYDANPQVEVNPTAQVSVRVTGLTSCDCEQYAIRNFGLFEPPTCETQWTTGPALYSIGVNGLDVTETFPTDCIGTVDISVDIAHIGSLEEDGSAVDVLGIFYTIDDDEEQAWFEITGDLYDPSPQLSISTGSQLSIRISGETSAGSEAYQITNFLFVGEPLAGTPTPVAAPPIPTDAPSPPPTFNPIGPTSSPSLAPTFSPVQTPVATVPPTQLPTPGQTNPPTSMPTIAPTSTPTESTATIAPTSTPTENTGCQPLFDTYQYVIGQDFFQAAEIVNTSCESSVVVSMQLANTGDMETSGSSVDYMKVFVQVDSEDEVLWLDVVGNVADPAPELIISAGSQLTLRIEGETSCDCEVYQITDFKVRPAAGSPPSPLPTGAPVEPPTPTDSPTLAPTDSTECQPLADVYQYVIGQDFFEATEIVNTSCESSILVSMQLANTGDMETSGSSVDYMKVFLQMDSEDEVLWLDVLGNVADPAPELIISAGSLLTLRIEGETSCDCEVYQITDFKVRPATPAVPTPSPTTTPTIGNTATPTATTPVGTLAPTMTAGTPAPSTTTGSIAVVSGELQTWHKITLTYDGPAASETDALNPFLNYRMDVTFSNGGAVYTVPGYFAADGDAANTGATSGNKWVCHFAPDATGVWQYSTSFVAGADVAIVPGGTPTSFDGDSGSFVVTESTKTGVDHRGKGRLEYVGEHHLRFAGSGTYFLKCGADSPENFLAYGEFDGTSNQKDWGPHVGDWVLGDPTWDGGTRGKGIIGALNYLSSKGMNAFSFLTMNIQGDDGNVFPYVGEDENSDDFLRMDVSKLAQWEIVFEHADKMGLFMHFKTQETENDQLLDGGTLGTERKLYYRELIARFSHHLALNWNLGEEITNSIPEIEEFSDYFKAVDPYQHIVILHTGLGGYESFYAPMLGYPTFDGASLQLDLDDVFSETLEWVERSSSSNPVRKWIVTNDEQAPSTDGAMPDNVNPNNQDMIRTKVLWGNIMAGGAGVEYYFGYSFDCTDLNCQDFATRDNMWTVSNHALTFFQSYVPFWNMSNENTARVPSGSSDWVLSNGSVLVVYINDAASSSGTIDMTGLTGQYVVQWYDPRIGGALLTGSVLQIDGGAEVSYGSPPSSVDGDWAILLRQL